MSDLLEFYSCEICDTYHFKGWEKEGKGDFRSDFSQFALDEDEDEGEYDDEFYGWEEVEMPEFGETEYGKGLFF